MIDEIIKKLDYKKIKFDNLRFLAGDASDRKYFLIKQENNTNVLMFDNDSKSLERFIKISYLCSTACKNIRVKITIIW